MPGNKPRRLVYLRDRTFRYVNTPAGQKPGPGIKWSSCNSTMNGGSKGGGGGGGSPVFQTATGVSYLGWQYQQIGEGIVTTGLIMTASVIGAIMTLPAFVFGAGLNAYGGMQTVRFSRPCSEQQQADF